MKQGESDGEVLSSEQELRPANLNIDDFVSGFE